jgi:NAD(P)H-dependent FMN reductase
MNISIISASHRKNSQSNRVALILEKLLQEKFKKIKIFNFDLFKLKLPMWSEEEIEENRKLFFNEFSSKLLKSDGFIFVIPEYGGMATPISKNFFLHCNKGELSHKPALVVSISSGNGGSYPISELRSSSYKNRHILWIPENIIIRNVEHFNPGDHGDLIPEWLDKRIDYVLNLLIEYSKCLRPVSKLINRKDFGNGM